MENEKKFVSLYLPVKLADKIESMKEESVKEEEILKIFNRSTEDIKSMVASLDEDVVRYRGLMITARNSFREAAQAELDASYSLWETFEKDINNTKKKVEDITKELNPLKTELQDVNNLLKGFNSYHLEDFLKTLYSINEILSYDNEKNRMIKFLMEKFTNEK